MSEEIFGLIFIFIWVIIVTVVWYSAMFRNLDKILSKQMAEFQLQFAFFDFQRRSIKAWYRPIFIKIVLTIMLFPVSAFPDELKEYLSPSGEYRAYTRTIKNNDNGNQKSEIIIKNRKGETHIRYSYSSPFSSRYGLFVVKAAWTADSEFFVYSMSSDLIGHRSWHHPTFFISIDKYKVISLDDFFGPIVYPDFKLSPPDIIHVVALNGSIKDELAVDESLSDLLNRR